MAIERPSRADLARQSASSSSVEEDEKVPVRVFLWTLFTFKILTALAIAWAAGSWEAGALLTATTWPFLVVPAMGIAGPVLFYLRLRRVRKRREQLRQSEWMVE
jgi:hypothetical protein